MTHIEELKAKWARINARLEPAYRRQRVMCDMAFRGVYGEHARSQGATYSEQFEFEAIDDQWWSSRRGRVVYPGRRWKFMDDLPLV
jgi:hypothetical protein